MRFHLNRSVLSLLLLLTSTLSCKKDDPNKPNTIVDVVKANGFTVLAAAIQQEGLADQLNGPGPFTVLAPTDAAFSSDYGITLANLSTAGNLRKMVLSQVISGSIKNDQFATGFYETLSGTFIEANLSFHRIGCGPIGQPNDLTASNGIVHSKSCIEFEALPLLFALAHNGGFSKFNDLLVRFPTVQALLLPGKLFTVFPPDNGTFDTYLHDNGYASVNDIPAVLGEQILRYHIVPDVQLKSTDFSNNQILPTLAAGKTLTVTSAGSSFKINGAAIIAPNLQAEGAFMHVIDHVLVP